MSKKKTKKETKKKHTLLIITIVIVVLIVLGGIIFLLLNNDTKENDNDKKDPNNTTNKVNKEDDIVDIIDVNSKSRNVAVMINNIKTVWGYQSGLQDAYIVYEIIAEGGITRFMALYKDANTARIGSIRSARIYYLDYVLENDAMYVHVGGSKEALSDIKSLKITDMGTGIIFRDKTLGLHREHTAFTSMENIMNSAAKRNIRTTTEKDNLFNYSAQEIDLSKMEGAIPANNVLINYSGSQEVTFEYDKDAKVYKRFQKGKPHIDYVTKEQYTTKNIITYQIKNSSYDSYGRQKLDNLGKGEGYYISNGYAVPITWQKDTRSSQTIYRYKNGEEIVLNDGNTFIQIQPKNKKLSIN